MTEKPHFAEHAPEVSRKHRDGVLWLQEVAERVPARLGTEQPRLLDAPDQGDLF